MSTEKIKSDPFLSAMRGKSFISRKGDVFQVMENGDIHKNGEPRYTFAGGINSRRAYYKKGKMGWAGVNFEEPYLHVHLSVLGKLGVNFKKKPMATLSVKAE